MTRASVASALFVVTEEGYWGEECIAPLQALSAAEFDITVDCDRITARGPESSEAAAATLLDELAN